ncbi:MAG: hypothetical protein WEA76_07195 [Acidimicrobiia bacterium]
MTERGTAPIELAVGVLVLLIPVALLVLSFGPVLERRVLARSLAVETARTLVEANGVLSDGDLARLVWQAESAGADPASIRVELCGAREVSLVDIDGCPSTSGEGVEVRVEVPVEPRLLPGGPAAVSYTHLEPVEQYRSRP